MPKQFQKASIAGAGSLLGLSLCIIIPTSTETAIANGDTRTLHLYHLHTHESIDATYRVDGHYDPAVLQKLNWFLRDWRRNEETNMDPRLFDAVWETYREAGATEPITVVCGYRSPQTNAMLRRRSRAVAEHSQHILGKAMDTTMPGMSMEKIREVAMRLQMGGVGYYGDSNFVHIDVGNVRAWPRMSYEQLARLFPDGKTVHIAADGRTLPGYNEARAEIEADGGIASAPPPAPQSGGFLAWLFGRGNSEDEHEDVAANTPAAPQPQPDLVPAQTANQPALHASTELAQADTTTASPRDETESTVRKDTTTADAALPIPPRRPTEFMALAEVPLPPARPEAQVAAAAPSADASPTPGAASTDAPDLPGIITQGPNDGRPTQGLTHAATQTAAEALAYAPMAKMEGLRSAAHADPADMTGSIRSAKSGVAIVPARLDGSNFRTLTGATEIAELQTETIFGPTLTGLRVAARVETAALSNKLESSYVARFNVAATNLSTNRFSGPSVASIASDKARMVYVASWAQSDGN